MSRKKGRFKANAGNRGKTATRATTMSVEDVRSRWREWAKREIGGSEARFDVAADAASAAELIGLDATAVVDIARQAAVEYDRQQVAPSEDGGSSHTITNMLRCLRVSYIVVVLLILVALGEAVWIASHSTPRLHKLVHVPMNQELPK